MSHPIRLYRKRRRAAERAALGWVIGPKRWRGRLRRVMQKEVRRLRRILNVVVMGENRIGME